ncbi:MAG: PadR family transcriptional regulator [bacterium]|nr:PadR family transcriptional regulator [bacterium]
MHAPKATVEIQNLSRDCHQALILAILSSGPHHGYQLALELEERSDGAFRFKHGTLYPILHRLELESLIQGEWLDEQSKRKRKRYALTRAGRKRLAERVEAWRGFFSRFFSIVEEAKS